MERVELPTPQQADYPHLSDMDWNIICEISRTLGKEIAMRILNMPEDRQKDSISKYTDNQLVSLLSRRSERSSVEKLKIDTTIYQGTQKGENLFRWTLEIETAMKANRIQSSELQVAFAISRLGNSAKAWAYDLKAIDQHCFPNWETFKTKILARFQPPNSQLSLRLKFLRIVQNKRPIHEYVEETRTLISAITENKIDMNTQVCVFIDGLDNGHVRKTLFRNVPETLERALEIAMQEDFSIQRSFRSTTKVPQRRLETNIPTPMDLSFVDVQQKNKFKSKDLICYRCQKKGHLSRDCRASRPNPISKDALKRYNQKNRPKLRNDSNKLAKNVQAQ